MTILAVRYDRGLKSVSQLLVELQEYLHFLIIEPLQPTAKVGGHKSYFGCSMTYVWRGWGYVCSVHTGRQVSGRDRLQSCFMAFLLSPLPNLTLVKLYTYTINCPINSFLLTDHRKKTHLEYPQTAQSRSLPFNTIITEQLMTTQSKETLKCCLTQTWTGDTRST